ncbi:hypothetical protein PybrP1_002653 [[Pythium] brassicae (nom. inval.)]|nr:hypothetical protein PybrP1_002653 [[Pythium] brassicae (nom. inval.)]
MQEMTFEENGEQVIVSFVSHPEASKASNIRAVLAGRGRRVPSESRLLLRVPVSGQECETDVFVPKWEQQIAC